MALNSYGTLSAASRGLKRTPIDWQSGISAKKQYTQAATTGKYVELSTLYYEDHLDKTPSQLLLDTGVFCNSSSDDLFIDIHDVNAIKEAELTNVDVASLAPNARLFLTTENRTGQHFCPTDITMTVNFRKVSGSSLGAPCRLDGEYKLRASGQDVVIRGCNNTALGFDIDTDKGPSKDGYFTFMKENITNEYIMNLKMGERVIGSVTLNPTKGSATHPIINGFVAVAYTEDCYSGERQEFGRANFTPGQVIIFTDVDSFVGPNSKIVRTPSNLETLQASNSIRRDFAFV